MTPSEPFVLGGNPLLGVHPGRGRGGRRCVDPDTNGLVARRSRPDASRARDRDRDDRAGLTPTTTTRTMTSTPMQAHRRLRSRPATLRASYAGELLRRSREPPLACVRRSAWTRSACCRSSTTPSDYIEHRRRCSGRDPRGVARTLGGSGVDPDPRSHADREHARCDREGRARRGDGIRTRCDRRSAGDRCAVERRRRAGNAQRQAATRRRRRTRVVPPAATPERTAMSTMPCFVQLLDDDRRAQRRGAQRRDALRVRSDRTSALAGTSRRGEAPIDRGRVRPRRHDRDAGAAGRAGARESDSAGRCAAARDGAGRASTPPPQGYLRTAAAHDGLTAPFDYDHDLDDVRNLRVALRVAEVLPEQIDPAGCRCAKLTQLLRSSRHPRTRSTRVARDGDQPPPAAGAARQTPGRGKPRPTEQMTR